MDPLPHHPRLAALPGKGAQTPLQPVLPPGPVSSSSLMAVGSRGEGGVTLPAQEASSSPPCSASLQSEILRVGFQTPRYRTSPTFPTRSPLHCSTPQPLVITLWASAQAALSTVPPIRKSHYCLSAPAPRDFLAALAHTALASTPAFSSLAFDCNIPGNFIWFSE